MNPIVNTENNQPLESWKEIANYLQRDVRTVARWEKNEGLPVHRHEHRRGASVYAYPSEIDAWREARRPQAESSTPIPLWRRMEAWVAAGVAVAAGLVIAYGPFLNPKNPVAEAAEGSMRTEQVWTGEAASTTTTVSEDGKWLIYTDWSTGDFWLRDTASGESRQITDKGPWTEKRDYAELGIISPDGKKVAAGWYNDEIGVYEFRVGRVPEPGETDNGKVVYQPSSEEGGYIAAVGWLSNSRVVFIDYGATTTLKIADLERDKVEVLKTFQWDYPNDAVISPDRRWIAYGSEEQDIFLLAADGSAENKIVEHPADDMPVAWTPDGSHLLFRSARTTGQSLWALPIADGKRAGNPQLVSTEFVGVAGLGVSPEGDLFYRKRTGSKDVLEARLDVESGRLIAKPEPILAGAVGDNFDPLYSPDGRWMAYLSNRKLGFRYAATRIVLRELESGKERVLSPTLGGVRDLAWSPDSSSLLFRATDQKDRRGIFSIGVEPGATERLLLPKGGADLSWMPDGQSLHYREGYSGPHWIHNLETGEERKLLSVKGSGSMQMSVSPDGERFAVMEHSRDDSTVNLSTFDRKTQERHGLWDMYIADGTLPPTVAVWTHDGKSILFWKKLPVRNPVKQELWIVSASGGEARKTDLSIESSERVGSLSLHPDGERIAYSAGNAGDEIWKLSNFLSRLGVSD